jgi:hypothetical protein
MDDKTIDDLDPALLPLDTGALIEVEVPGFGSKKATVAVAAKVPVDALAGDLASKAVPTKNAGQIGFAPLGYGPDTIGGALPVTVWGNGVSDKSTALSIANAIASAFRLSLQLIGVLVIGSPVTITVPIVDTMAQIFSTGSNVTIDNKQLVRPEWFGSTAGNLIRAYNALPSTGGVIQCELKTYPQNGFQYGFSGAGVSLSKPNVTIQGRKMPRVSNDATSLTGGTIIQGMFTAFAENLELRDLGVDCGKAFVDANMGGVPVAGFADAIGLSYPNDASKAAADTRRTVRLHNVVGLCYGPAAPTHGVLIEGYTNAICTGEVMGFYGLHGIAIKSATTSFELLRAYCNNTNGIVIKSDTQASAVAKDCQIGAMHATAGGPPGIAPYAVATTGMGLRIYAANNDVGAIRIAQAYLAGYPSPLGVQIDNNKTIENVQIESLTTDQAGVGSPGAGILILASSGQIQRFHIGDAMVRNCGTGLLSSYPNNAGFPGQITVGRLEVVNSSDVAVMADNGAAIDIGQLIASNCAAGVYRLIPGCRIRVGSLAQINGTATTYTATSGGAAPALANGWTQVASNDPFSIDLLGGRVGLRGLVKPGSTNTVSVLPAWARPVTNKRFMVQGYNGTTVVAVPLVVDTSGNVTVNEIAGGTANCSTWLSLSGVIFDQQA